MSSVSSVSSEMSVSQNVVACDDMCPHAYVQEKQADGVEIIYNDKESSSSSNDEEE